MSEKQSGGKETRASKWHTVHTVELTAFVILIVFGVLAHKVWDIFTYQQIAILAVSVIVILVMVSISASWFFARPRDLLNNLRDAINDYEEHGKQLEFELRTTLRQVLEKQPYVDEDMLSIIEAEASNIWVITTDLSNDVRPGRIKESVEANLKSGKQYTYFVPSPANPNFPDAASNESAYRKWSVYIEHREQVRFIHLPNDTLFLFKEVVVYNPFPNPNRDDKVTPKGFTYFETGTDKRDRLMKIPDSYLDFLKGQLHRYSEAIGINAEIERLVPDLKGRLSRADLGYLGSLIGQKRIEGREFAQFLASLSAHDPDAAMAVEKVLERYVEPAP
jgi:hypothetical protein